MLRILAFCAGVSCINVPQQLKQPDPSSEVPRNQVIYVNEPSDGEVIHYDADSPFFNDKVDQDDQTSENKDVTDVKKN